MMNEAGLLSKISKLKTNRSSPHKPFMLLIALARIQQEEDRLVLFEEVEELLDRLLRESEPPHKTDSSHYPFCRLMTDDIWELFTQSNILLPSLSQEELKIYKALTKDDLKKYEVKGGFNSDAYKLLKNNPQLIKELAAILLNKYFLEEEHQKILDTVGLKIGYLDTAEMRQKRLRDAKFRERILTIYQYRCAVCSFQVRLGIKPLALDAAHIKWFHHGGIDVESNGLALCVLHHKLFDRGAFSIDESDKIIVSNEVNGDMGLNEWLLDFHNKKLLEPSQTRYKPGAEYTKWHREHVFFDKEKYKKDSPKI